MKWCHLQIGVTYRPQNSMADRSKLVQVMECRQKLVWKLYVVDLSRRSLSFPSWGVYISVSEMVVPSYSISCFMYIPEKLGLFPLILYGTLVCKNNWVHYGMKVVFVCFHITLSHHHYHHHSADAESIELTKYFKCPICVLFSNNVFALCRPVCCSLPMFLLLFVRIFLRFTLLSSSNRIYESLCRVRSWNNGMRCMYCYVIQTWLHSITQCNDITCSCLSRLMLTNWLFG